MNSWIFDLDGVVTSLQEKKITNPLLVEYFVRFLKNNEPVTLNTGRSLAFIRQEVLIPLVSYMQQQQLPESLLHNFFAVGEKGNAWIEDEKDCFDNESALPKAFEEEVQQLIEHDFSDTMFFDTTKHTMISVEMHTGLSIEQFTPEQHRLLPLLQSLLEKDGLSENFHIDPDILAINIEAKSAGKGKGIERIMQWLAKRQVEPTHFVAFGDGVADIAMGEKLQELKKPFTFVFVGEKERLKKEPTFPVIFTNAKYDKGVVEYLQSLS